MTTIIRRYHRPRRARLLITLAATALALALAAWLVTVIWAKGGPQRLHEIVIALPAPQRVARVGPRA